MKPDGLAREGVPLPRGSRQRAPEVLARLRKEYPEPYFFLKFDSPFQLLVSVILSAQTTDAQVNRVTPALFAKYPTAEALAAAPIRDVEKLVHSTGFYKSKARHIRGTARRIVDAYDGEVPTTMAELMTLPGVARKTANVVQELVADEPEGVCVDTHVKRVAYRLGLASKDDATKAEGDLMRLYPRDDWSDIPFYFITHGRTVCAAKVPRCSTCFLADLCPKRGVVAVG
jgi:endonuclease-3